MQCQELFVKDIWQKRETTLGTWFSGVSDFLQKEDNHKITTRMIFLRSEKPGE